jgi:hypothetical protein
MTEFRLVDTDGDLAFSDFDIPGGIMAVQMGLLRKEDDTRARTLIVRFPDGWSRPGPGYYEPSEEVLILQGELALNGDVLCPGDWAVIPARALRWGMRAYGDVLAFARFDGPARYEDGNLNASTDLMRIVRDVATSSTLEAPPGARSWVGAGTAVSLDHDVEVFSLDSRHWAFVPAGLALPTLNGPCFWRTTDPRGLS